MFGFIAADTGALTKEQLERYRGCYCGLCRALGERHGLAGKITLSYDMTFLVLLLSSLYEPEEESGWNRCIFHPGRRYKTWQNRLTDYAADMSVFLGYYKCVDDWQDEHRLLSLSGAKLLEPHYRQVRLQYPRQCSIIEKCFTEIAEIEKSGSKFPDAAPNSFGRLMGSLFAYYDEDHWTETLERFGMALGKFIYIMDACIDLKSDRKHGRYNPLFLYNESGSDGSYYELLNMLIGDCSVEFEKLPLVQDIAVLRNIIYSGVWQKYRMPAGKSGEEK